jgi:hypothetical protein
MFGMMNAYADWIEGYCPAMMKLCMPRRYINPHDYVNPRIMAAQMTSQWVRYAKEGKKALYGDQAFTGTLTVCDKLMQNEVPTYFVSKELLKAVAATDIPKDFTLNEITWPFPAMAFVLPISFMREFTGYVTPFVSYAVVPPGINVLEGSSDKTPILNDKGQPLLNMWYITFHGGNQPVDYVGQFTLNSNMYDVANCKEFKDCSADHPLRDLLHETFYNSVEPEPQQEHVLINKLHAIIPSLLLLLTSRPKLLESTNTLERPARVRKNGKSLDALWSPNFIGQAYRIPIANDDGAGVKRPHLRRGHYTWQVRGNRQDIYSISRMPLLKEGGIDWDMVSPEQREKFLASHERKLIDAIWVNYE